MHLSVPGNRAIGKAENLEKEAAGGSDLQHALSCQLDLAEIFFDVPAQIPLAFDQAGAGQFHVVVEVAIRSRYRSGPGVDIIRGHLGTIDAVRPAAQAAAY